MRFCLDKMERSRITSGSEKENGARLDIGHPVESLQATMLGSSQSATSDFIVSTFIDSGFKQLFNKSKVLIKGLCQMSRRDPFSPG